MAVFIRKERLGSGSDARRQPHQKALTQRIEALPEFKVLRNSLAAAKNEKAAQLSDKFESNAEVQAWRQKTPEEQTRDAIDRMIPTAKALQEVRTGQECSSEDARKVAEGLAYKSDRQKAGE